MSETNLQVHTIEMLPLSLCSFLLLGQMNAANQCRTNLKKISIAVIMHANSNYDTFSFTNANAKTRLKPYLMTAGSGVWNCPVGGSNAYTFNEAVLGKNPARISNVAKTVLIYEGHKGKLDFRHDGKAMVGFCDGHVMAIDKASAKTLVWKP